MSTGQIVAGCIAPHPPHLVYAENPPQNEPHAECGWETLRWAYERLRKDLDGLEYDAIVILSPHWQTYIGTHFLGVPHFKSLSVDPVFPNLFRYHYELDVDVALAEQICAAAAEDGLVTKMMRNPDFRVDYGTIVSCHLTRPAWDKPIVSISSCRNLHYYNTDVMQAQAIALGRATRRAIEASGKRVVVLASHSLSHRHFTREADVPEDMSREHIYDHHQYLWDMKLIDMLKKGQTERVLEIMSDYVEQSVAEADSGALSWLISTLDTPSYPPEVYGYGTVIGTGNAVVGWFPEQESP